MDRAAPNDYDLGLPSVLAPLAERRGRVPVEIARRLSRVKAALTDLLGSRLRDVRLFGSYARGEFTDESDVDVLILLDRVEAADSDAIVATVLAAGGIIISPLIFGEAELQRLRDREKLIAQDLDREGISL